MLVPGYVSEHALALAPGALALAVQAVQGVLQVAAVAKAIAMEAAVRRVAQSAQALVIVLVLQRVAEIALQGVAQAVSPDVERLVKQGVSQPVVFFVVAVAHLVAREAVVVAKGVPDCVAHLAVEVAVQRAKEGANQLVAGNVPHPVVQTVVADVAPVVILALEAVAPDVAVA